MAKRSAFLALCGAAVLVTATRAAETPKGLTRGTPDLKSAGPLAFGPDGLLFVGDATGAAIFAIDTGDRGPNGSEQPLKVEGINEKVAALLGVGPQQILINDLAVNPASGKAYLSVSRGRGPEATPVILRVDRSGKIEELPLQDVAFARAALPDPPAANAQDRGRSLRSQAITDLAYVDGRVLVAGLSNEEFSSRLLALPYPFAGPGEEASVEIYHGSHGRFETRSPIRTFVAYRVGEEPVVLAAYTCTPLVKIPVAQLRAGGHVKGTTIAELGNRNSPLDMIVYKKGGRDYLLMANSSRGVMKVRTEGAEAVTPITAPVADRQGLPYETIEGLKGVLQLDELDPGHAVVLLQTDGGAQNLETVDLP